ncbi:BON domain-containing protein [Nannocystis exedens]|uniref:BON domain-containing protein n=1 Tax=Nannocystis exedens TaxID=54 RepID=A0A1I2ESU1_9BACT|nr:BON domain-containing protein [Nannocystis exedens]PCC73815.1 putative periplasmic or secreted lipoprotein [Nannocystis exedens]SFE95895.1 BON domain-containing protein [Nannocystis exedens]
MQNDKHHHRGRRRGHRGRRDLGETRGLLARAIDRVRAWFGDEEATSRLRLDARRSRRDARLQARAERRQQKLQRIEELRRSGKRRRRERTPEVFPHEFVPSPQVWPWQFMGRGAPWPPSPHAYYQQVLPTGVRGRPLHRRGRFSGHGPRGYTRPDARIVEDINEALTYSPHIDASDIEIRVDSGDVVVTGTVDDRYIKRLVEDLIEDVSGVRDVQNNLRVERRDLQGAGGMNRASGRRDDFEATRRDMTVGQDFEDLEVSNLNTGQESCSRKERGGNVSGT